MKTRPAAAREWVDRRAGSRAFLAAGIAVVMLTACQDGLDIGALNRCDSAVRVNLAGISEPPAYGWHGLDVGERGYAVTIPIDRDLVYFWVDTLDETQETMFSVPVDELTIPPGNYRDDYDLELTLEGDRCPAL